MIFRLYFRKDFIRMSLFEIKTKYQFWFHYQCFGLSIFLLIFHISLELSNLPFLSLSLSLSLYIYISTTKMCQKEHKHMDTHIHLHICTYTCKKEYIHTYTHMCMFLNDNTYMQFLQAYLFFKIPASYHVCILEEKQHHFKKMKKKKRKTKTVNTN